MTSERKLASARANGARSTGAKTPEGRRNSALGPTSHALLARSLCLTIEAEPKLLELLQEYTDHFQPVGPAERNLVEAIVVAKWQEQRIWTVQTATLDLRMESEAAEIDKKSQQIDPPTRLAIAFSSEADKSGSLALLLRYANSHRRAYEKSLDLLLKIQAARVAHGSSLGQASPPVVVDPPPDLPDTPNIADIADLQNLAEDPDPSFTKEPNPIIEHPVGLTICPTCGRTVSPKWNTCDCGGRLRP